MGNPNVFEGANDGTFAGWVRGWVVSITTMVLGIILLAHNAIDMTILAAKRKITPDKIYVIEIGEINPELESSMWLNIPDSVFESHQDCSGEKNECRPKELFEILDANDDGTYEYKKGDPESCPSIKIWRKRKSHAVFRMKKVYTICRSWRQVEKWLTKNEYKARMFHLPSEMSVPKDHPYYSMEQGMLRKRYMPANGKSVIHFMINLGGNHETSRLWYPYLLFDEKEMKRRINWDKLGATEAGGIAGGGTEFLKYWDSKDYEDKINQLKKIEKNQKESQEKAKIYKKEKEAKFNSPKNKKALEYYEELKKRSIESVKNI